MTRMVYQITKLGEHPGEQPIIIAMTTKKSAQRIIAALAEQGELDRAEYRVNPFQSSRVQFRRRLTPKGAMEC
jgi:hypothetical protein